MMIKTGFITHSYDDNEVTETFEIKIGRVFTSLADQWFAFSTLIPINEDLLENFQYAKTVSSIPSWLTNLLWISLVLSPLSFVFHS